jgi:hypothetical protein
MAKLRVISRASVQPAVTERDARPGSRCVPPTKPLGARALRVLRRPIRENPSYDVESLIARSVVEAVTVLVARLDVPRGVHNRGSSTNASLRSSWCGWCVWSRIAGTADGGWEGHPCRQPQSLVRPLPPWQERQKSGSSIRPRALTYLTCPREYRSRSSAPHLRSGAARSLPAMPDPTATELAPHAARYLAIWWCQTWPHLVQ